MPLAPDAGEVSAGHMQPGLHTMAGSAGALGLLATAACTASAGGPPDMPLDLTTHTQVREPKGHQELPLDLSVKEQSSVGSQRPLFSIPVCGAGEERCDSIGRDIERPREMSPYVQGDMSGCSVITVQGRPLKNWADAVPCPVAPSVLHQSSQ